MNIWKYLHHLLSGAIILLEGIILLFLKKPLFYSILFILVGLFLVIDDIFAETMDKSLVGKIHSDPIKLKKIGIIFFLCFQLFFALIIIFY